MEEIINLEVKMPCDENGLIGRECPKCKQIFKVKLGTGLDTTQMYCPYCSHCDESNEFLTKEQVKLVQSYAMRYITGQVQDMFSKSFKSTSKNSFCSITYKKGSLPSLYRYKEKKLETKVICNNCGLEYAIYGVFANCPDCNSANQLDVLKKSLEVTKKKLDLINEIEEKELQESLLENCLTSIISAFDGFGKGFVLENLPKFQRFYNLYEYLNKNNIMDLKEILGDNDFRFINKMFQVRHLYEHNMGVIDDDFLIKTKLSLQIGRKYLIQFDEIERMIKLIDKLGADIYNKLCLVNNNSNSNN